MNDPALGSPAAPGGAPPVRVRLPLDRVWLTYLLIGLIGVAFAGQVISDALLGQDVVLLLGAKVNALIARGEWWRLITPIFVHGSLLHVLFNLYALYALGQQSETVYGWQRFLAGFFLSGLGGSVASLLLTPVPSVGASGAVFGLIGMVAVFYLRNRQLLGERGRHALQNVAAVILLNLLYGLSGGIDNWAHLGGLATGLALGGLVGPLWQVVITPAGPVVLDRSRPIGARWLSVAALALGLLALAVFLPAAR